MEVSSDKRSIIKAISSGYFAMIISLLVSIWMVPFSLKYLTKSEYGIYAIISDLLGWFSITNLGISASFSVLSAQLLGQKNYFKLSQVASTTIVSQIASSILIVLFGIVIILFPGLAFGDVENVLDLRLLLGLVILTYLVTYTMQPLGILLTANKQIHVDNILKIGLLLLRTIITVVLFLFGYKLISIAISGLIAAIVVSFITYDRVKKSLSFVKIRFENWDLNEFKGLLGNGLWISLGGVAGLLIFRMDTIILGKYMSLEYVTYFLITFKLYQIADTFHQTLFNSLRPYFAQIFGAGEKSKLKHMYDITFYSSFLFAFVMGIFVFSINKIFIKFWVGEQFYLNDTINMLLCINFILQASVLPNRILLSSTFFKVKSHNLTRVFEGLVKIILVLLFVDKFGAEWLIFSSILASIIFSNFFLNFLAARFFDEPTFSKISIFFPLLLIPVAVNQLTGLCLYFGLLLPILFAFAIAIKNIGGIKKCKYFLRLIIQKS